MEEDVPRSASSRRPPSKYPSKPLPTRKQVVKRVEQKKPETKARQEIVKRTVDAQSKAKSEERQKTDDKEQNDDAAIKKESDAAIQEMFPECLPKDERELDALTTRILEYELRHIMIKVWQEFPDDPPTDEEKLVAEKFRNEAGDDIRNVIGLNVTKRLLNVHNKLIVKVRFSNRPEKSYLLSFLKEYNIRGFKRVVSETNTFAAHLKTIDDFDRICSAGVISCGNAKLTITPCYTFMKCPPKLKTKFVDETDDEKTEIKDKSNDDESQKKELKTEENTAEVKTQENKVANASNTSAEVEEKVADKINTKDSTEINNKPETIVPKEKKTVDKECTEKLDNVKAVTNITVTTQAKENKITETKKVPATAKNEKVTNDTKNTQPNKEQTVNKVPPKAPVKINNAQTKNVPKPETQEKKPVAIKKDITKNTQKVPQKAQNASKKTKQKDTAKDVSEKYNDYDEMDDEDILALLSEGVVLDECGSDDE